MFEGLTSSAGAGLPAARGPGGHGRVPSWWLEAAEGFAAVGAAVGRLSLEQRAALLLREVEGLSYDQIAEVLGVSVAAVKSRIYRARVEVARDLGNRTEGRDGGPVGGVAVRSRP